MTKTEAKVVAAMRRGLRLQQSRFSLKKHCLLGDRHVHGVPVSEFEVLSRTINDMKEKKIIGVRIVGASTQWVVLEDYDK